MLDKIAERWYNRKSAARGRAPAEKISLVSVNTRLIVVWCGTPPYSIPTTHRFSTQEPLVVPINANLKQYFTLFRMVKSIPPFVLAKRR